MSEFINNAEEENYLRDFVAPSFVTGETLFNLDKLFRFDEGKSCFNAFKK